MSSSQKNMIKIAIIAVVAIAVVQRIPQVRDIVYGIK